MSQMTTEPERSGLVDGRSSARPVIAWCVTVIAGSAVLGLLAGLIWGEVAPRATLREIGTGVAELVHVETRAFIGADVWFCGIAVAAGVLTGVLGYRFGVAARTGGARAAVAACLILGAVAGVFTMLWLGGQIGLAGYTHNLASSPKGTLFSASLALGAKSALVFWPMFTAIVLVIAEWSARPASQPVGPVGPVGPAEPADPAGHPAP